ncbi:MAG: hypothetical protein ABI934_07670 [Actinomycetota bacterium]
MSPSERDKSERESHPAGARPEASEHMGSSADSEESAAHIAELVRRTTQRIAAPGPSPLASPDPAPADQSPMTVPPIEQPAANPIRPPQAPSARPPRSAPSRRTLFIAGAVIAVLVAGILAMSRSSGSDAGKAPVPAVQSSAPAGYAVKVSDVITDCAGHARGQVKVTFEKLHCVKASRSLATGRISGRPALFVVSRIQMPTAEAAASVKQVLDGSGTGNLNDLLREGKTFPGAPAAMPASGYTSVQTGAIVTVVEAGFSDKGPSSSKDAALRATAAQVAEMVAAQK